MLLPRRCFLASLGTIGATFAVGRFTQAAETAPLRPTHKKGDTYQVQALFEVGGDLRLKDDDQAPRVMKVSVVGKMEYVERLLNESVDGRTAQAARRYRAAEATIKIDKGGVQPTLRADRRTVAVDISTGQATLLSSEGPLTREELDLIELPGNTVLLDQLLLSDRDVAVGDRWQHGDDLLAALLSIDAVSKSDVFSEVTQITADVVRCDFAGNVHGAINGVATDMQLKGRYKFDRRWGRISWFAMLNDEQRAIGHVGPGADVTSRLQIVLAPTAEIPELADAALAPAFAPQNDGLKLLEYRGGRGQFAFVHDRRWHVMQEDGEGAALRMVDRGELLVQCNVRALAKAEPGKHFSLAAFQADIQRSLDKSFGQFLQASESTNSRGYVVHRVVAIGTVAELPIEWHYYLVADPLGHQVVFAFTAESEQVPLLGEVDQSIVDSVELAAPTTAAVKGPVAR